MSAESVIDVKGLGKSFNGRAAVRDVSLKVMRGDIFGFLGPNGSGKTTTIRMLCGLLTPDRGGGVCLGHDLRSSRRNIRDRIGYMTQRFSLYEDLTVRENLTFTARVYGVKNISLAVEAIMERFGLSVYGAELAGSLSGGWKQRLSLAAALMHDPPLLLLDEPTAGVDPAARASFWTELHTLAAGGITILISTHYMDEAEHCNRLAFLLDGEIPLIGNPEDIVLQSGLWSAEVRGPDIWSRAAELKALSEAQHVSAYGSMLRVSGYRPKELSEELEFLRKQGYTVNISRAGIEEVLIGLIRKQADRAEMDV